MSDENRIPTSKIERAARFIKTGAKVGGNYAKYLTSSMDKETLHQKNADDIYDTLSKMKGGPLKALQMMAMNHGNLPAEYTKKFTEAQYNAPAMSYPLVAKTFKQATGKYPEDVFNSFSREAVHAASIGQVHEAYLNGKRLAVKVQYPGIADSMKTDMRLVKPLAGRLLNIKVGDIDHYMQEVEARLMEETDYNNELNQSVMISEASKHFDNIVFPKYYPELSNKRVLTMDWIEGTHLDEWLAQPHSKEEINKMGQTIWDFFDFQVHELHMVHADPHPGNFLVTPEGKLAVLDFGCVKRIPDEFYVNFVKLIDIDLPKRKEDMIQTLLDLQFLHPSDSKSEREFFYTVTAEILEKMTRPIHLGSYDFSGKEYFEEMNSYGQKIAMMKEVRDTKVVRGPRDGIYLARVYFGVYNLLHALGATVDTHTAGSKQ